MIAHEVNRGQGEFFGAKGTSFLIEIPGSTLHFNNFVFVCRNVVQIFPQLVIQTIDMANLIFQILKQKALQDPKTHILVLFEYFENKQG